VGRDLTAAGRRVATDPAHERSDPPTQTLSTTPVPVDATLRRMIALGWLIPALVPAAAKTVIALFRPAEAGPMIFVTIGLYAAWGALMIVRPWRALLVDVGRLLLARIPFVLWLVLACVLALVGSTHALDTPWWALTTWVLCFVASAAYAEVRRSPKRFAFTLATLGLTAALLVAADRWVTARVMLTMHHNVFVEHDPVLGWKLRSNMTIVRERRGETLRETINDQGFRTRPPADRPAGVKRVLFVGDSHTEAYGVDDGSTYTALVERRMARTRPVEVVALGVAGFSTDQEMLTYVLYGRPYRPDLVVLQFCSNDVPFNVLDRYWRGHKPRFERFGDVLLLTNVPVPNIRNTDLFASTLLQRSSIMLSVEHVLRQLTVRHRVRRVADMEEGWRVTGLLLRDLDRIVRSDGARLVVFHADRNAESEARLQKILAPLDIPYVDTNAAYRGDMASYWDGPHWNEKGQEAVADVLGPALLSYL
jgi:lysophospholipase L1-like esterase